MSEIIITADTSQVDQAVDQATVRAQARIRAIGTAIRRSAQVTIFASQAILGTVNQSLSMMLEAIGVSIELATNLATFSSLTGFGLIQTGLMAVQIGLLLATAANIEQQKIDNTTQLTGLISTVRVLTY